MRSVAKTQQARPVEFEDGRSYDPSAVQIIERDFIEKNLKERELEFTEPWNCTILCASWNVNAKKNDEENMADWLLPNGQGADIYAIGFQEIVDLNAVNVAVDNKSKDMSQYWQRQIETVLDYGFEMVVTKHLVGLLLCIYVKRHIRPYIRDIRCVSAGVGVMGVLGNKGGVSVHFYLHDSSICFVCSHLAAHRENIAGRNSDYHNIIEKTIFYPDTDSDTISGGVTGLPDASETSIIQHDIVFWLGDLNYRIDDSLSTEEVFDKINENDIPYLRKRDQLNIERLRQNVFHDFEEGELLFHPTYKYQVGTNSYDRRPEKKVRPPAWCDRILWKVLNGLKLEKVNQTSYYRAELSSSDHKPIGATFNCIARKVVTDRQRAVRNEILQLLDKQNNDSIPKVNVIGSIINFGKVYFDVPRVAIVKLSNTGNVLARWRLIPKLGDREFGRGWLSISPVRGVLLIGQTTEIKISFHIDAIVAHGLNNGTEVLEDIIVLRVENGCDAFLTISGDYARSAYGTSVEELVCTDVPIRSTLPPEQRPSPLSFNKQAHSEHTLIPKELWRLVDAIWRSGMKEPNLLVEIGDEVELFSIREALDTGTEFSSVSSISLGGAVVQLLSSLPAPIIPVELLPTVEIDPTNVRTWCRRFLDSLSPLSYNIFIYMVTFMREILRQKEFNRLTSAKLAAAAVGFLTRITGRKDEQMRLESMQTAVSYFLTTSAL